MEGEVPSLIRTPGVEELRIACIVGHPRLVGYWVYTRCTNARVIRVSSASYKERDQKHVQRRLSGKDGGGHGCSRSRWATEVRWHEHVSGSHEPAVGSNV